MTLTFSCWYKLVVASLVAQLVKNPPASAGDLGSVPGLRRSPGGRNGNPLQYSCLENPMDRGTWQAADHGIAQSWTQLSIHTHMHIYPGTGTVAITMSESRTESVHPILYTYNLKLGTLSRLEQLEM